jgi:non-ribosomal peptide synthase protein (TIGR01720 family)
VEDLEAAYRQLTAPSGPLAGPTAGPLAGPTAGPVELPAKTTSFKRWGERLAAWAAEPGFVDQLATPDDPAAAGRLGEAARLPLDLPGGREANSFGSVAEVRVTLSPELTEAVLRELPEAFSTGPDDALVTALAGAFAPWTGSRALLVDLEGHGRDHGFDDVDLTRTVGWLTVLYPVLVDPGGAASPVAALRAVRERLREARRDGLAWGVARWLGTGATAARLARLPEPEVGFNYLGRLDRDAALASIFRPAAEPSGPSRSPRGRRAHLIELECAVSGGRLDCRWVYSARAHRRPTVERLAERFVAALEELVEAARRPEEAAVYTPSDFPEVDLEQDQLDQILKRVGAIAPGAAE